MRENLLAFILLFLTVGGRTQTSQGPVAIMVKLDSIRQSPSISRHFAGIYLETTAGAVEFFKNKEERAQQLIERLEVRFANYFLLAVSAYRDRQPIDPVWEDYYADSTASPLRYILFGINAHINGDIWQALTTEFSEAEIRELKPFYVYYHKELLKIYRDVYASALETDSKIRAMHTGSLGLSKLYGKILLRKWRKRQMMLAELYYSDKELFGKKREELRKKMEQLNQLIRKRIG